MVFRSRIDTWLLGLLVAAPVVCIAGAVVTLLHSSGAAAVVATVGVACGAVLPLWILASTRYVVADGTLQVKSGPFSWRIPIASITSIEPTNSALSGPALSLARLRVEYGGGKCILISPADQAAFLHAIEGARYAA